MKYGCFRDLSIRFSMIVSERDFKSYRSEIFITKKYHVFAPMGIFQLELIYFFFCLEVTSTPTRPVDNVVITTKGVQDRKINILDGTTVEKKVN